MRRAIAVLAAAGWWTALAAAASSAASLAPFSYRLLSGTYEDCCPPTAVCEWISRDVAALSERDGVCVKLAPGPGEATVQVELTFYTSQAPGPFELRLASEGAWQDVAVWNWSSNDFDAVVMTAAADEESASGIVSSDHVDPYSGAIVVTLSSYELGPARDDKTLDEVEIVIPPPM